MHEKFQLELEHTGWTTLECSSSGTRRCVAG